MSFGECTLCSALHRAQYTNRAPHSSSEHLKMVSILHSQCSPASCFSKIKVPIIRTYKVPSPSTSMLDQTQLSLVPGPWSLVPGPWSLAPRKKTGNAATCIVLQRLQHSAVQCPPFQCTALLLPHTAPLHLAPLHHT